MADQSVCAQCGTKIRKVYSASGEVFWQGVVDREITHRCPQGSKESPYHVPS